jgi:O-antigen ligase
MAAPSSGWRLPLAYVLILLGLVTLAMTLPAIAMFGWGALLMIFPGFGLVAAGLILLLIVARPRQRDSARAPTGRRRTGPASGE